MGWNSKSLKNSRLYLILDTEVAGYDRLLRIAQLSVRAGVDIMQLRDKAGQSRDILKFARSLLRILNNKIPFILNDRVDLACISGAAGVHLGQDDVPLAAARKLLGPNAIIGASCQNMQHAQEAERSGADYIGFGSVFKTKTKPGRSPMELKLLKSVAERIKIPVFAIGGITPKNIFKVKSVGVQRIAVCRSICEARDVPGTARKLKSLIEF